MVKYKLVLIVDSPDYFHPTEIIDMAVDNIKGDISSISIDKLTSATNS